MVVELPPQHAHHDHIAPRLDRILEIKGDVAGKKWFQNFSFRGLTFAHGNWNTPPNGNCWPQADAGMPAALFAEGALQQWKQCGPGRLLRLVHRGADFLEFLGSGFVDAFKGFAGGPQSGKSLLRHRRG